MYLLTLLKIKMMKKSKTNRWVLDLQFIVLFILSIFTLGHMPNESIAFFTYYKLASRVYQ